MELGMSKDAAELPAELGVFIHSCIESIEQVELLLLMRGSEPMRTARDVASEVGVSVARARGHLETLAARGLLEVRVGEEIAYRYRPKSDELARYCDVLAQYYITSRQALLGFVAADSRLSIKRFAEAFRLRNAEKS
jgi:DNA-binding FadR family transcriptional regulator